MNIAVLFSHTISIISLNTCTKNSHSQILITIICKVEHLDFSAVRGVHLEDSTKFRGSNNNPNFGSQHGTMCVISNKYFLYLFK